ncbi:MAG: helix-turn-helix domain-containing protein [Nitrospirae bacterium]|nr:helix-turn-helix domain-containing protein [Nitrospirota bacterium]
MSEKLNRNTAVTLKDIIANIERQYILIALESTEWVQSKAAKRLGISQRILGYKIKKYGITIKHKTGGLKDEDDEKFNQCS